MASLPLSDADLHGLVDGHLEPSRRIDVLKRLALSSTDRVRVEAWQKQTDLLRNAFVGIEHEALPANLDLNPKPRLHCVSVLDAPITTSEQAPPEGVRRTSPVWIKPAIALVAVSGVIVWFAASNGGSLGRVTPSVPHEPIADRLAQRAAREVAAIPSGGDPLPTITIPDLGPSGFTFIGMTAEKGPASLQMIYRNGASDRLVISVAKTVDSPVTKPQRVGAAYVWHTRANAFAITGTIDAERLRSIAAAVQADEVQ